MVQAGGVACTDTGVQQWGLPQEISRCWAWWELRGEGVCTGVRVGMLRDLLELLRMLNKRVRLSLYKGHSGSSEEEPWGH